MRRLLDSDGVEVRAGDKVRFSYGIPPVLVIAPIIESGGKLWVVTECHKPSFCNARSLKKHVGEFWRENDTE